ncbi:MAG: CapA family protein [Clostridia bacterium]|nr:CapA family protein [Clostridia bacterium]
MNISTNAKKRLVTAAVCAAVLAVINAVILFSVLGEKKEETVPLESFTVEGMPSEVSAGEQFSGTVSLVPENADCDIVWTSSDESTASVSGSTVTAFRGGAVTVTVSDRKSGLSTEFSVNIKNDYFENTKAAVEYIALSYTDAEAVERLTRQQTLLSRCTDPAAKQLHDGVAGLLAAADGTAKCDFSALSQLFGLDAATLRKAVECIHLRGQMSADSVTLSFTGDCTFGYLDNLDLAQRFPAVYRNSGSVTYPFDRVRHIFALDDITVINYEATLADKGSREADKKYHFRGEPEYVNILTQSSVETANLANNHTLDYLQAGFDRTVERLSAQGVKTLTADTPVIMEVNGVEVVLVGAGHWKFPTEYKSSVDSCLAQVKQYKRADNIVIVNLHWGGEYVTRPVAGQIDSAHMLIDEGADMIVGHHAHIVQGIEVYNGKVIAYGLDNFSFGGSSELRERESFILRATFAKDADGTAKMKQWSIVPCYATGTGSLRNDFRPIPLYGAEGQRTVDFIEQRSALIGGCEDIPWFNCE